MGVFELLGSHILIWALKEQTMSILPHPKQSRAHLPIILYLFIKLCLLYLQLWQFDKTDMSVQDMYFCEIPTWTWIWAVRHLGSWELGPPSASEMAADLETLPMLTQTPQYRSCPTVQYLHKTAQYAEWGGYNICTCPYLCTYNHMLDSRGGEQGFGGRQEFRRTDLGRWVLPSGVLAGHQEYRPCTRI